MMIMMRIEAWPAAKCWAKCSGGGAGGAGREQSSCSGAHYGTSHRCQRATCPASAKTCASLLPINYHYVRLYIYYDIRFQSQDVNKLNLDLDIISMWIFLWVAKSFLRVKNTSRVQSSKSAQIERFRLLFLRKNEESLGIKWSVLVPNVCMSVLILYCVVARAGNKHSRSFKFHNHQPCRVPY